MEELELDAVASGDRLFTDTERQWAISQHDWLWEYVDTQDKENRDKLTDKELAKEVQSASWDYVRCECM